MPAYRLAHASNSRVQHIEERCKATLNKTLRRGGLPVLPTPALLLLQPSLAFAAELESTPLDLSPELLLGGVLVLGITVVIVVR